MSQKIYSNLDIKGNATIGDITNATSDTDKFLVSDAGVVKYRTGSEMLSDLGVAPGVASNIQHQVKAGVAINKGQAVYVTGADGTNMIVGLASNAAEVSSSKTMGLMGSTVAINGFGNVIAEGLLAGLNTSTANAGDPVWLGTGGNLIYGIVNKPYAPSHLVFIGIVTRSNISNGEIFVKVQNGFELDELHDADLKTTTPINGHILGYNGTLWVNKTIAGWLGYTPQSQLNGTGFVKASGTTVTYDNTSYYPSSNPSGYISSYSETDTLQSVVNRGASSSTQITLSGGGDNLATYSSLRFAGYNQGGGVGYHGFFEVQNTYGSATNPKKFFRIDGSGAIQIINSAYTNNIFNLTDAGDLTTSKFIKSGGTSAQILAADGSVITAGSGITISGGTISSTGSSGVTSFNTRTGAVTLTSGDVTGALGYTPYNATNPNGYITSSGSISGNSATVSSITANTGLLRDRLAASALIDGLTATNFRTTLFGASTSGYQISTARWNSVPTPLSGLNQYSTMFAWAGSDTHGFLAVDYNAAAVVVGGGNGDLINWTKKLAFSDGTGSSGTWGINVTGSAGSLSSMNISQFTNNSGYLTTSNVLSTVLTPYSVGANIAVTNTDTIETAIEKLQGQVNARLSGYVETDTLATVTSRGATTTTSITTPSYAFTGASTGAIGLVTTTSSLRTLSGDGTTYGYGISTNNSGGLDIMANQSGQPIRFWAGTTNVSPIQRMIISAGDVTATDSFRSPIFYDSNNTGYYVDPASTSNLNIVRAANSLTGAWIGVENVSSTSGNGISLYNGAATGQPTYGLMFAGTATYGNHGSVTSDWATYFTMNSGATTRGWIFRTGTTNVASVSGAGILQTSGYIYSSDYIQAANSMYSPLYYDANNTAYYLDPASTSNLYALTVNQTISGNISGSAATASNLSGGINSSTSGISSMKVNDTRYWVTDPNAPGNYFQALTMGNGSDFTQIGVNSSNQMYYRFNGTGSTWYTVLSSNNYTSFAVPLTRTITINGTSYDLSANRSWTITASETDTLSTVTTRGNTTGANIITSYNTTTGVANNSFNTGKTILGNFHVNNGSGVSGNNSQAAITFQGGTTNEAQAGIYVSNNSSTGTAMGFATTDSYATGPQLFLYSTNEGTTFFPRSYSQANGSFRAPVFYDSDDTTYYANLASTSDLAVRQRGGTLHGPNPTWGKYLLIGGDGRQNYTNNIDTASVCTTDGNLHIDSASTKSLYLNFYDGDIIYLGGGASNIVSSINNDGSHRPQIIYDYNNTGYYVDPASTTNLNTVNIQGLLQVAGATGNYNEGLRLASGTGSWSNIQFGTNMTGVGTQANQWIVGKRPDGNFVMSLAGNQDGGSRFLIQQDGRVQSPAYYDGNDTGFYLDPNGTSNLDTITATRFASRMGSQSPDNSHPGYGIRPFYSWNIGQAGNATAGYSNGISIGSHPGDQAYGFQIVQNMWDDQLYFRRYNSGWQGWRTALDSSNYTGYRDWGGNAIYAGILYDGNNTGYYVDPNGTSRMGTVNADTLRSYNYLYLDNQYGSTIVGVYNASRLQGVFAMGDSYKLAADGTSASNHYGIAWSHPNAGGTASNLTDHGMLIQTAGSTKAAISSTIWCIGDIIAYSDARVKDNVKVIDNPLERLKKVRGVTFTRKDFEDKEKRYAGVIAQEMREALPEVVSENSNGELSVSYGNSISLLIECIKEQQTQIEELKQLINQLTNK